MLCAACMGTVGEHYITTANLSGAMSMMVLRVVLVKRMRMMKVKVAAYL